MKSLQLLPPSTSISGSIRLSGSKSLSNRLLVLKAQSGSDVSLINLSDAEDSLLLQKALQRIGISDNEIINVNHAGADLRFLCAYLSTCEGEWLLTGSSRLCERPVSGLVTALRELGANIEYAARPDHPPLKIRGKKLKGGKVKLAADISSQYVSALMLCAPRMENGLEIELIGPPVSFPYITMTAEMLRVFGYPCTIKEHLISIPSSVSTPSPSSFSIESDWSSASYWFSLCALSPGSIIELETLYPKSTQADSISLELFKKLGVDGKFFGDRLIIQNTASTEKEFEYNFSDCPDLAPTLACTCFGLGLKARLTGLKTLQLKESRRIDALKNELMKLGAKVDAGQDHLSIEPGLPFHPLSAEIETYQDHRMAMSFAPLSVKFPGLLILEPDVVNKSYPRFWQDLQSLGFHLNLQT